MSGSSIVKVACPVCGVRMPEAEVDVHLDLCLYEQTEREELAEAQRRRQQQPQRQPERPGRGSVPPPSSVQPTRGSAESRMRASSERTERSTAAQQPSPFPATPTHVPQLGGGAFMGFPPLQPTPVHQHQQGQHQHQHQQQAQQQRAGQQPMQQKPVMNGPAGMPPQMFYYAPQPASAAGASGSPSVPFAMLAPQPQYAGAPPSLSPPFSSSSTSSSSAAPLSSSSSSSPLVGPYQPLAVTPNGAVQAAYPYALYSPAAQPPLTQSPQQIQQQQQQRLPPQYMLPQMPPSTTGQVGPPPAVGGYPAQQFYAVPQLTPQYQAFIQKYQTLQQSQSFTQFPQILQKTPSQQSLLGGPPPVTTAPGGPASAAQQGRPAASALPAGDGRPKAQQPDRRQAQPQPQPQPQPQQKALESPYFEYCEGWLFVCERPSVRFVKSWTLLREAGLHLFDAPPAAGLKNAGPRLVLPLTSVKALLLDAHKNTGKRHSFGVQCRNDQIFYFATRSADEIEPWLQGVRKELRRLAASSSSFAFKEIQPKPAEASPAKKEEAGHRPQSPSTSSTTNNTATTGKKKSKSSSERNGPLSGLFAKLSSIAVGSGDDKSYKTYDEEFLRRMREDAEGAAAPTQQQLDTQKAQIFGHMNKIFALHNHPLGKIMIDFTDSFMRHKDRILSARPSTALTRIIEEIRTFLDRLTVTVEHYYGGEVAHVEQFVHTARLAAEHCVFSSLYDVIYPVYVKRYIVEDTKFQRKMEEFADISTSDLIDNPKLWLLDDNKGGEGRPGGGEPYQKAINMMAAITELATPVAKLHCLVDTSRIICGCVNEYWTKRDPSTPEIAVSCDDLLPILLYVLIKSKLATVHTESMYMQDFIGEREQMQIEGYSLATFQAASAALLCLERDSLRKDARGPGEDSVAADPAAPSVPSTPASPTPPASSPSPASPSPASPSPTTTTTTSTMSDGSSNSNSSPQQRQRTADTRAQHRARRASWISSVLAQQAALPLAKEEEDHDSVEREGEAEDEDWSFFKSAGANKTDQVGKEDEQQEQEQEQEEDFLDSFRPPSSSSSSVPASPGRLLLDWDDGDRLNHKANETNEEELSNSEEEEAHDEPTLH